MSAGEGSDVPAPKDLLERIQLRSDESLAGVGERVADLPAPDLADLVNQLPVQKRRWSS